MGCYLTEIIVRIKALAKQLIRNYVINDNILKKSTLLALEVGATTAMIH